MRSGPCPIRGQSAGKTDLLGGRDYLGPQVELQQGVGAAPTLWPCRADSFRCVTCGSACLQSMDATHPSSSSVWFPCCPQGLRHAQAERSRLSKRPVLASVNLEQAWTQKDAQLPALGGHLDLGKPFSPPHPLTCFPGSLNPVGSLCQFRAWILCPMSASVQPHRGNAPSVSSGRS